MRRTVLLAVLVWMGCTPLRLDLGNNDDGGGIDAGAGSDAGSAVPIAIASGRRTTMVLTNAGEVWAWGEDGGGQLAISPGAVPDTCALPSGAIPCSARPMRVPALSGATAIALGMIHGCALRGSRVVCFGYNPLGMLGTGAATDDAVSSPVDVGIDDAVGIAVGDYHSCAIHADGGVSCWGLATGQSFGSAAGLGTCMVSAAWITRFEFPFAAPDSVACALRPTRIPGLTDVRGLALGFAHTCAVDGGNNVFCLGSQERGQIGNGIVTGSASMPIRATGDVSVVVAGSSHNCALRADGVTCWGSDANGEAGVSPATATCGATACVPSPTMLDLFPAAAGLTAGDHHTCVLVGTSVYCFGDVPGAGDNNESCMAGPCRVVPTLDASARVAEGIAGPMAGGSDHTCAITLDGRVACWGAGVGGQLGDAMRSESTVPVFVSLSE